MTYAEQVKAEVAARYGVPVLCEVRFIPQGVQAIDPTITSTFRKAREAHFANKQRGVRLRVAERPEPVVTERRKKLLADMARCAAALSGHLDPLARAVLTLRAEGRSFHQIAAATGKSPSVVHGAFKRAAAQSLG